MSDEFVLATISWARNEAEENLLANSIEKLAACGFPVVASDGGSPPAYLERLRAIPNVTVAAIPPEATARLQTQVQTALQIAAEHGPKHIFYTEPDKCDLFKNCLPRLLNKMAEADALGVTLLARDEASFATFPAGQRLPETLMNALCGETFGPVGDYQYGPFALAPEIVPHICAVRDNIGWGWRQFAWSIAHRLDLPIRLLGGNFPCPEDQRGENELKDRIYRLEQFAQGIQGLALGLKTPLA